MKMETLSKSRRALLPTHDQADEHLFKSEREGERSQGCKMVLKFELKAFSEAFHFNVYFRKCFPLQIKIFSMSI